MAGICLDHHSVRMAKTAAPQWSKTFLREWRENAKLSLEAVAPKMDLTHGQLSKIERGIHPYNQRVLEVAAELYHCTVQDILIRAPSEAEDIFGAWPHLNERQRREVGRFVRAVREDS